MPGPTPQDHALAVEYLARKRAQAGEPPSPAVQEALHSWTQAPSIAEIEAKAATMGPAEAAELRVYAMALSPRARAEAQAGATPKPEPYGGENDAYEGEAVDIRSPYANYSRPEPYGGEEGPSAGPSPYEKRGVEVTIGPAEDIQRGKPARQGKTVLVDPKEYMREYEERRSKEPKTEASLLGDAVELLRKKLGREPTQDEKNRQIEEDPDEIRRRFYDSHGTQVNQHEVSL